MSEQKCLKETRNSYLCVTPENNRLANFYLMKIKIIKSTVTKKSNSGILMTQRRKLLKVAAFVYFELP